MKIVLDVDGVLADFTTGYCALVKRLFGKVLPNPASYWDWDLEIITQEERGRAWEEIKKKGSRFWSELAPLEEAADLIAVANYWTGIGHEVYYATVRPGDRAHEQTRRWLVGQGVWNPCVVTTDRKGEFCRSIGATVILDDKPGNIADVLREAKETQAVLYPQPHNVTDRKWLRADGALVLTASGFCYLINARHFAESGV